MALRARVVRLNDEPPAAAAAAAATVSTMAVPRHVEHRSGRLSTLLRERRLQLVVGIVVVEGLLVLFDVVPWWGVLLLAAAAFATYVFVGRTHPRGAVREATWIAAVSQLVVVLVPALALVVTALAVVALVLLALAALALVVLDRRSERRGG